MEKSEHPLPLKGTNSSGALLFFSTGDGTPDLYMVRQANSVQLATLPNSAQLFVLVSFVSVGGKVWRTPLISVVGGQRQFEFEAKSNFHASRGYVERPFLRQKHPKNKKILMGW